MTDCVPPRLRQAASPLCATLPSDSATINKQKNQNIFTEISLSEKLYLLLDKILSIQINVNNIEYEHIRRNHKTTEAKK